MAWSPPAPEQRGLDRFSHRELDRVAASLRLPGSGTWTPVQLWDFTSVGFGVSWLPATGAPAGPWQDPILIRAGAEAPSVDSRGLAPWQPGEEVEFRIRMAGGREFQIWCQVRNATSWRGGFRIGLRRLDVGFPQTSDADRRSALRLALTSALSLKARIRHPFLYGHWSRLLVSDLNKELGFSFLCRDPSILLFEGLALEIRFELAAFRQESMQARVSWVHATAADEVRFGVECVSVPQRLHNALCDYLLFAQFWTPARLRQAGFQSKQVRSHLRFGAVRTMDDYAEVLYLRRDAYVGAGKRPEKTRPEHMSAPLDGRSRILLARHHGKVVGTMTLTFPGTEETVLDSQAGFPGGRYPVPMPPKMNLIEVSRLCIDDSYRGTDLLVGMFEHGLKHFLMSDRHWLLTSATDELLPLYLGIGFVRLKASYRHPLLNNKEHHLIIARRNTFLWGFGMNLLVWNSVVGDLVQHLLRRRLIELPGWARAIIRCKLLLRPLARWRMDAKAGRAFRKHFESLLAARRREARARGEDAPAGLFTEAGGRIPVEDLADGRQAGPAEPSRPGPREPQPA